MSMDFFAGIRSGDSTTWAFSADEMQEDIFDETLKDTGEWPYRANPAYRADLNLNLSNANMREVFQALGFTCDDSSFSVEIERFINTATAWLQRHIDTPSPAVTTSHSQGRREHDLRTDGNVVHLPRAGAKMIDCGRAEGYLNDRIRRMVHIAQEGRARGANVVYAA